MPEEKHRLNRNSQRESEIENGISGMLKAVARLKDDLRKAGYNNNPRQYAQSAIFDAEFVIEGQRDITAECIGRIETTSGSKDDRSLFFDSLKAAELECANLVSDARTHAKVYWPIPMD